MSSSPQLAGRLQAELASKGIFLQVADSSRDLGADFAGGARRRVTIQSKRLLNVTKGVKVVLKMGKTKTAAKNLSSQLSSPGRGALPPRAVPQPLRGCFVGQFPKGLASKKLAVVMPLLSLLMGTRIGTQL